MVRRPRRIHAPRRPLHLHLRPLALYAAPLQTQTLISRTLRFDLRGCPTVSLLERVGRSFLGFLFGRAGQSLFVFPFRCCVIERASERIQCATLAVYLCSPRFVRAHYVCATRRLALAAHSSGSRSKNIFQSFRLSCGYFLAPQTASTYIPTTEPSVIRTPAGVG